MHLHLLLPLFYVHMGRNSALCIFIQSMVQNPKYVFFFLIWQMSSSLYISSCCSLHSISNASISTCNPLQNHATVEEKEQEQIHVWCYRKHLRLAYQDVMQICFVNFNVRFGPSDNIQHPTWMKCFVCQWGKNRGPRRNPQRHGETYKLETEILRLRIELEHRLGVRQHC